MAITTALAIGYNALLLSVSMFALIRGGGPERVGALVNLAGSAATGTFLYLGMAGWSAAYFATWAVDLPIAGAFFLLSIRSVRFWPIWSFGFALADVMLHVVSPMLPTNIAFYYASVQVIWAYMSLGVLTLATARLSSNERGKSSCGWRSTQSWKDQV